ncbi:hypothetical protein [Promicromonospora sp. NPDC057488]|uniref:hypothetical protein n=1 Tax=Promicromonospora sp. NPDC057488 TaxID=3346147 RepID=UPI00366F02A7
MLDSDSLPDLASDLISRGGKVLDRIAVDAQEARALVQVSAGRFPVEFVVDLRGLARYIESARGSAHDVFPDVDPIEGGLRLASENLWAEVESGEARVLSVGVDRQGQIWRRTEPPSQRSPLPPGDYRWTAGRKLDQGRGGI